MKPPLKASAEAFGPTDSVAERLRFVQSRRKIKTDREFAELVGVARSSMSAYFKGTQIPRPSVLHRIAAATHTDVNWLLGLLPETQSPESISLADSYAVPGISDANLVTLEHFSSGIRRLEAAVNHPLTAEQRVALAVRLMRDVMAELAAKPKESE